MAYKMVISVHSSGDGDSAKPPSRQVSIFVAIDTSGSMMGNKIQQVCDSLQRIIDKAPGDVKFVIRKFSDELVTVVSKKKSSLNLTRLHNDLKKCGNMTALYDALCQVIEEIPYNVSKTNGAYLLVFTDGGDNYSKTHNLESVLHMVNTKLHHKVQLIFIQAGPHRKVADAIEAECSKQQCTVIRVEDSVCGINYGFEKAKEKIQFEVKLGLQTTSNGGFSAKFSGLSMSANSQSRPYPSWAEKNLDLPKPVGFHHNKPFRQAPTANGLIALATPAPIRPFTSAYGQLGQGHRIVTMPTDTSPVALGSMNLEDKRKHTSSKSYQSTTRPAEAALPSNPFHGQGHGQGTRGGSARGRGRGKSFNNGNTDRTDDSKKRGSSGRAPKAPAPGPKQIVKFVQRGQTQAEPASATGRAKNEYIIQVSQIPVSLVAKFPDRSLSDILLEFFRQWGECKVSQVDFNVGFGLTATVTYDSEENKNFALKYGGQTSFHHAFLEVRGAATAAAALEA